MKAARHADAPPLQQSASVGACVLCGGRGGPVVVSEAGYDGRACSCGIVYIDPFPESGTVDLAQDRHLHTYYSLPAAVRLKWVSHFQPSGRLLEVGCGGGEFLALAKSRGYQVAAVEPNPAAARKARELLGVDVEQSLIEESRLVDGSYDVVFHVDLLSHFPDPVRALRKMARLVRPGGVVCFEVGIFGGLARGWYRWVGRIGYPHHLWLYSESAVESVLERAGLQLEAVRRFGLLPATILSTIGNHTVRPRISRPRGDSGRAPRATGFYLAYSWFQYALRYRLGAVVPAMGPHALFVAARPRNGKTT